VARIHGRSGLVFVGASMGAAASPVAYMSSWDISFAGDWSDVTPHQNLNLEYAAGLADVTGDFSGFYDDASVQLYADARDGLPRSFYLYPDWAADPAQYWFGELIAAFTLSGGVTSPVSVKATWKAASDIHRSDFQGIPPASANVAGHAAAITVAGGTGALVISSNIAGVAAAITVAGGTGQAGSVPANVAGTGAAITVAAGAGVPSAGANVAGAAAAVSVDAGIGVAVGHGITVITFTTAGSSTWLCPSGITSVDVYCVGGGGHGGNGAVGTFDQHAGGGGGGGGAESAEETALAVTPGNSYNYTVGAAATNTTFGPDDNGLTVTAHKGGTGGNATSGNPITVGSAGAAGTGSTNAVHHNGGAGHAGTGASSAGDGGGGGGSGGTAAAGSAGGIPTGASAVTGGGPGGNGSASGSGSAPSSGPGGGGGAGTGQFGSGAAGAVGEVTITYST
jgi:hypothetical protein